MRMKSIYVLAVAAVAVSLFAAWTRVGAGHTLVGANQRNSAAYRDGFYLGALAARRAQDPHIASGRWAFTGDRLSFAEGYREAYEQTLAALAEEDSSQHNNGAAYRDGLYLGQLDAVAGRPEHVSSGRWVQFEDRRSFAIAYRQAYADTTAVRSQRMTSEVSLVR